jgi:glycosyltransferase involved in cell wall biosynthesis
LPFFIVSLTPLAVYGTDRSNEGPWKTVMREESTRTRLSSTPNWKLRAWIYCRWIREYLLFDNPLFKIVLGFVGASAGWALYSCGKISRGFGYLARIHRSALAPWENRRVVELIHDAYKCYQEGKRHPLHQVYETFVKRLTPTPETAKFFESPEKIFQGSAIVLKSARTNERGVLTLQYSYVYPLLAKLFDLEKIAARYFIILEPSWSGYCDLNVLIYTGLRHPIFVGSIEPRDTEFITQLRSNLIAAPFSSNTWVDDRVFRPLPGVAKNAEIIMVAGWAPYKRHHAFFRGLSRLRRRRVQPKVILAGYPIGLRKEDILREADLYGVTDLLEVHEWASPTEVNQLLNRSKVNVLWSRREGVNRAIIEGMLAGTPCLVREGLNFGYHYPHINSQTGRFSTEEDFPQNLFEMIENHSRYSPREWVLTNMSCLRSVYSLNEKIKAQAKVVGENWTEDIVPKVNELGCMRYRNAADEGRFLEDYDFLRSCKLTKSIA